MSSSFFRIFMRLAIFFAIAVFALQPYNWFCKITNKCAAISLSRFIPAFEGKEPIEVAFEITNYREDLDIRVDKALISTVTGRKNTVIYRARNLTNQPIRFRTAFFTNPESAETMVKRYECLCANEYKLKKNEEIELKLVFALDKKIVKELFEDGDFGKRNDKNDASERLVIRYKIK